jgi:hypothetical protein
MVSIASHLAHDSSQYYLERLHGGCFASFSTKNVFIQLVIMHQKIIIQERIVLILVQIPIQSLQTLDL